MHNSSSIPGQTRTELPGCLWIRPYDDCRDQTMGTLKHLVAGQAILLKPFAANNIANSCRIRILPALPQAQRYFQAFHVAASRQWLADRRNCHVHGPIQDISTPVSHLRHGNRQWENRQQAIGKNHYPDQARCMKRNGRNPDGYRIRQSGRPEAMAVTVVLTKSSPSISCRT